MAEERSAGAPTKEHLTGSVALFFFHDFSFNVIIQGCISCTFNCEIIKAEGTDSPPKNKITEK
jgi:hypothetical protein